MTTIYFSSHARDQLENRMSDLVSESDVREALADPKVMRDLLPNRENHLVIRRLGRTVRRGRSSGDLIVAAVHCKLGKNRLEVATMMFRGSRQRWKRPDVWGPMAR